MERAKLILKRIFVLPLFYTVIIAVPAFLLVAYVLIVKKSGPLAYLAYVVSAYALIVTVTGCWRMMDFLWQTVKASPLCGRLISDTGFRTEISLYQGFIINLLYITIKMVSGIYYRSLWFIFLAGYYILLAVMRFLLLFQKNGANDKLYQKLELRRYRFCGIALIFMNFALAGIVAFMVHQNRGYNYPGMLIYAMAAYSFYAVIIAIVNVVKCRRHGSPILSAAKVINLVAAMVSILSLETAMLSRFGNDDSPLFRKAVIGYTGGVICILVLGIAVFMIAKSSKQINLAKIQND